MVLQRIPNSILTEILLKLDLETLSSVACVSKTLNSAAAEAVSFFSDLHLPVVFSPNPQTLNRGILGRCRAVKSLTFNCHRLDDSSLVGFLGSHLLELNLLCCSSLSCNFLSVVAKSCPNLRVLVLELAALDSPKVFFRSMAELFVGCLFLDSISLQIRGEGDVDAISFEGVEAFLLLPKATKTLKLKSLLHLEAIYIIETLRDSRNSATITNLENLKTPPLAPSLMLQCLSLTLDVISDEIMIIIVNSLPFLVELHLEDRPNHDLLVHHDLTNTGLYSLSTCHNLKSLSLIRGRHNYRVSFKSLNDISMFFLSEGCRSLESVRFCGFSKVRDAGFASIFASCKNLKKIEIRNALHLSDLTFNGFDASRCPLTELRLLSCNFITCESVKQLSYSTRLEVLDLCGCKSISNSCLYSISSLRHLSSLNLTATDITDYGLFIIGQGSSPIIRLSLRSCKRVTDEGIFQLLHGNGTIRKTLSALDLGYISGITDESIQIIASIGIGIIELCIRSCFHVTDSSVEALAMKKQLRGGGKSLRRLDLFNCIGISIGACRSFRIPLFPGLQWLGIGKTRLNSNGNVGLVEFCSKQPWLTLCSEGCEVGCHDGWQFHRS